AAGLALHAGGPAHQRHAFANAVQADASTRGVRLEAIPLVAHFKHDVAIRAAERELGQVDVRVTTDVAERFLGDAEERELGLLVETGRALIDGGGHGEAFLAEGLDEAVERGTEAE